MQGLIALPARALFGWIENALEDYEWKTHRWRVWNAIQPFEVKELLLTTARQLPVFLTLLGISSIFGYDGNEVAGFATATIDYFLGKAGVFRNLKDKY